MERVVENHSRLKGAIVWILRLIIGATFTMSGFVKAIDIWGSVFKIEEYLQVWGWNIPDSIIVVGAGALAAAEFVFGFLLLVGLYRRLSVWIMLLMMAVMLPLTAWIAIADPVADCGCFGDFLVISNTATFLKNILITLALIYLARYNTTVGSIFGSYMDFVIGGLLTLYILIIEIYGYNIQPMLDFRRFAEGTELISTENADEENSGEPVYSFIYENAEGERREFGEDNLPDDSVWTFVDRKLISGSENQTDGFAIVKDGEDIAPEIVEQTGPQFIVTIPDVKRTDISSTYKINDLNDFITGRGGSLIALIGNGSDLAIDYWRDISMADYGIYHAEPTLIKELARGTTAIVYLENGEVQWKRSLSSVNYAEMSAVTNPSDFLDFLRPQPLYMLKSLTFILVVVLLTIFMLDRSGKLVAWSVTGWLGHRRARRERERKEKEGALHDAEDRNQTQNTDKSDDENQKKA